VLGFIFDRKIKRSFFGGEGDTLDSLILFLRVGEVARFKVKCKFLDPCSVVLEDSVILR
jgi:hypothetical protein